MGKIAIRPDMRTAGGEVSDVVLNGRYVGGITLVYREGSRLSGSVQLERSSMTPAEKRKVLRYLQDYIHSFAAAIEAEDCDVIVTYSPFDQVIAMEHNVGEIQYFMEDPEGPDEELYQEDGTADAPLDHDPQRGLDPYEMESQDVEAYELVITGEHGDSVEYHIYGRNKRWLAEAFVTLQGADCFGEINWMIEPTPEQIEAGVDLLVSDFDDDYVDSFQLEVKHNGELLEIFELDHQDLAAYEDGASLFESRTSPYSVHLVRDDGDTLTYDIYSRENGNLPIGTATIDISEPMVTGYMDFREMNSEEDREKIAALIMRELDKERDYDSFSLSVLYRNRLIDELLFENEAAL